MKKAIYVIGLIIILLLISISVLLWLDPYIIPSDWQTVEIGEYGSFKVPESWKVSVVNEFVYISSEESGEGKNILVQRRDDININEHFAEIEELVWMWDIWFSNSAGIIKYEVRYKDGSSAEIFALEFTGSSVYEHTEFLCVDDSVSERTLKKIVNSYIGM